MTVELNPVTSGYSTNVINDNFQKVEDWINLNALWRQGVELGQANQMELPLDMNGFPILNIGYDLNDPGSPLTIAIADSRYLNLSGGIMQGSVDMGNHPVFVRNPVDSNEPVRKEGLDQERSDRIARDSAITQDFQAGDANLQAQLTGEVPLEASAFSPISWHDQFIGNSVTIPENKNAWSFGPSLSLSEGQAITIEEGSYYTIAEGSSTDSDITFNGTGADISTTYSPTYVSIISSTGSDADISGATPSNAGVLSASDKSKLDSIEVGATADQSAAEIKTSYESNDNTNAFTDSEKAKLTTTDVFDENGDYTNLRARGTTKTDVGLSGFIDSGSIAYTTPSKVYWFYAYLDSNYNKVTDPETIPFGTTKPNSRGFNTSTYEFTCPVTGVYSFTASLFETVEAGGTSLEVWFTVNGVKVDGNYTAAGWSRAGEILMVQASTTLYLNAGDTVTVVDETANTGGTILGTQSSTLPSRTFFTGVLL